MKQSKFYNVRLIDLLFPSKLLEKSNYSENPLLIYSLHRSKQWSNISLKLSFEAVLIFLGASYFLGLEYNQTFHRFSWNVPINLNNITYFGHYFALPILSFLMLRYHLYINDHSHHIKSLRYNQLEQLLLSRLDSTDYFLHHFLYFCHRYRVFIVFTAFVCIGFIKPFFEVKQSCFESYFYDKITDALFVVLMTWIMGVFQYVWEWHRFAGKKLCFWNKIQSVLLSLLLSFGIMIIIYILIESFNRSYNGPWPPIRHYTKMEWIAVWYSLAIKLSIVFFSCMVTLTYANYVYKRVNLILWQRIYQ